MLNLEKGQKINLTKDGSNTGDTLTKVRMGLGWDKATSGLLGYGSSSIDLDASCMVFDGNKSLIDTVSFRKLTSSDGAIRHSGDNLTGAGEGEDEKIYVDLAGLRSDANSIVFTVNSYQGQTFDKVGNCFVVLADSNGFGDNGRTIAEYKLAAGTNKTALVMAKLYKHNGAWKMAAIGHFCDGRTAEQIRDQVLNFI